MKMNHDIVFRKVVAVVVLSYQCVVRLVRMLGILGLLLGNPFFVGRMAI